MKLLKFGIASVMVCGLLAACAITEAKTNEDEEGTDGEYVQIEKTKRIRDVEEMTQKLEDPEFVKYKEWVAKMNEEFQRSPEERFDEAANDVGYVYYLRAKELRESIPEEYMYSNDDRDLSNLHMLAVGISHHQFVRTVSIDETGKAKENLNYVNEWEPLNKYSVDYYESIRKILNDLDVAYNQNGEGKTFGVTYLLDGENIAEVEKIRR